MRRHDLQKRPANFDNKRYKQRLINVINPINPIRTPILHNGYYMQDDNNEEYPEELFETKYSRRSNFSVQPKRRNYGNDYDFNIMKENNSAYF